MNTYLDLNRPAAQANKSIFNNTGLIEEGVGRGYRSKGTHRLLAEGSILYGSVSDPEPYHL